MIELLHGACARCSFEATVGIGRDEEATVAVHWAPANCPACGLVSVNIYSYGPDSAPRCRECDELVEFYVDWGIVPKPPSGWPCPGCGEYTLAFAVVDT